MPKTKNSSISLKSPIYRLEWFGITRSTDKKMDGENVNSASKPPLMVRKPEWRQ